MPQYRELILQQANDTIGDGLVEINYFFTGPAPDYVCNKVMKAIPDFQHLDVGKFVDATVVAAAAHRHELERFLALPGNENVAIIILKHFPSKEMYLLGHIFLACGLKTRGSVIRAVGERFKADHIWDADLSNTSFGPNYLQQVRRSVLAFRLADVARLGRATLHAMIENNKKFEAAPAAPAAVDKGKAPAAGDETESTVNKIKLKGNTLFEHEPSHNC